MKIKNPQFKNFIIASIPIFFVAARLKDSKTDLIYFLKENLLNISFKRIELVELIFGVQVTHSR